MIPVPVVLGSDASQWWRILLCIDRILDADLTRLSLLFILMTGCYFLLRWNVVRSFPLEAPCCTTITTLFLGVGYCLLHGLREEWVCQAKKTSRDLSWIRLLLIPVSRSRWPCTHRYILNRSLHPCISIIVTILCMQYFLLAVVGGARPGKLW